MNRECLGEISALAQDHSQNLTTNPRVIKVKCKLDQIINQEAIKSFPYVPGISDPNCAFLPTFFLFL